MKDSLLIQEGLREIPLHPQPQTSSEGQTIPEGGWVCVCDPNLSFMQIIFTFSKRVCDLPHLFP